MNMLSRKCRFPFALALLHAAALSNIASAAAEQGDWAETIADVAPSIVSIHVNAVRAFDTEWNMTSQATGFVVDAENGIILTNRHVVQPGPVTAEAVFRNHEEVTLYPVYRDPVHDFGFYRYDPDELRYIDPESIDLRPEKATVGREIRVIGNDAGEQLSILSGTLARLDRDAPYYGRGNYNDFNTFYIQAASGTSGGSSGSPVIDIDGDAVALNAAGSVEAASSFFLPLERVVRALEHVRRGEVPPRGTLETTFVHEPFDELRRLGLREDTERLVRDAREHETGMLVVSLVQPAGASDGLLQPGDILVRVNGELVTSFARLEGIIDDSVGQVLAVDVERGGKPLSLEISVTDLHSITPDEYVEFGGAVVHDLSYQQARHLHRPQNGVYVANAGYVLNRSGISRGAVIVGFNGEEIYNLQQFRDRLMTLKQGERARLRFFDFEEPRREVLALLTMDWRWFPANHCQRNDDTGFWDCEALTPRENGAALAPATAHFPDYDDPRMNAIARSVAFVQFDMPYLIDGVSAPNYFGTALIVDHEAGLAVADRNTVPVSMGDARMTFAGSIEIPARVIYVHPLHNLVVLKYDPALLGDTPVEAAVLHPVAPEPGEPLWVIGYQPDQTLQSRATRMQSTEPLRLPLSSTFRFRDTNLETFRLEDPVSGDGPLVDAQGRVRGLWSSFAYQGGRQLSQLYSGMPVHYVEEILALATGKAELRSLETEFFFMPLSSARKLGLPQEWAGRLERLSPRNRRVLAVERLVAASPAAQKLREGDLLLGIDGTPVADFRAVENATQKPVVELTILRDAKVQQLEVATVVLDGRDTSRMLMWAGAQLQNPHRAIAAQRGIPREGVFVAYFGFGSPASRYDLTPGRRIIEVDGKPTPDLDAFIDAVRDKGHRAPVRLKTVLWDGRIEVITLKTDLRYWPTYEIHRTESGWKRRDIDGPAPADN
ncbi:MAG TPA: trypsin-like peptidase domain-containing protein [Gammaproteobacteria bacterium]